MKKILISIIFFISIFSAISALFDLTISNIVDKILTFFVILIFSLFSTLIIYFRFDNIFGYRFIKLYKKRAELPLEELINNSKKSITLLGGYSDQRDENFKEKNRISLLEVLFKKSEDEDISVTIIFYGPSAMSQRFEFIFNSTNYKALDEDRTKHVKRKTDKFLLKVNECINKYPNKKLNIKIGRIDVPPNHVIYEFDENIYITLLGSEKAEQSPVMVFKKGSYLSNYFNKYLRYIKEHLISENIYLNDLNQHKQNDELLNIIDKNDNLLIPASKKIVHQSYNDTRENERKLDLYPHRHVYCIIIHGNIKSPRILLQQRSNIKKENPGVWDKTIGGHVRYGESYQDACIRQIQKELGHRINNGSKLILLDRSVEDFYKSYRKVENKLAEEKCHYRLYMYFVNNLENKEINKFFLFDKQEIQDLKSIQLSNIKKFIKKHETSKDLEYFFNEKDIQNIINNKINELFDPNTGIIMLSS